MNCEQVKELLSPYLDNTLAQEERQQVATHLQHCVECSDMLADFRRFDALLTQLPRISPNEALREKIFSSPAYQELTGTFDTVTRVRARTVPSLRARRDTSQRPRLIVLPGGRQPRSFSAPLTATNTPKQSDPQLRRAWIQRIMLGAIAAALVLTMGVGSIIGLHLLQKEGTVASNVRAITPPAGLSSNPIPAGVRFVFLRDGALWSAPTDGGTNIIRLTPENVIVADNWVVRPPYPGHSAGNLIAYIDLQRGYVHTLRSDGQSDTVVPQPLLKVERASSSLWNTETGSAILNSLRWSKDGNTLAFVADPEGTGQPGLYLYSPETGQTGQVHLPLKGAVSSPIWSPDGVRLAFKFAYNGEMGIMDYNTNNHGVLTIVPTVSTPGNPNDTVLSLDWSPDTTSPTITWSAGVVGHVHDIWSQPVGTATSPTAFQLASGDYVEAIYSRSGDNGAGSWLLVTSQAGLPGDVLSLDLTTPTMTKRLTKGKQVSLAQWSPDGSAINYFDSLSSGSGTLHITSLTADTDTLIAANATSQPAPTWSHDGQRLAYSTGSHILVTSIQSGSLSPQTPQSQTLNLSGTATTLSWSVASSHQLILASNSGQAGIYLVDTQHNTSLQLDKTSLNGPIQWTQIP
jgi:Tol biopolymer transport system component